MILTRFRRLTLLFLLVVCTACDARTPSTLEPRDTTGEAAQLSDGATTPRPTRTPAPESSPTSSVTPTASATRTPTLDPNLVLPDLRTLPPESLRLEITLQGEVLLRFSNSIMNAGPGAIELVGVYDAASDKVAVTQHLYMRDDTFKEHKAGQFIFHPGHEHWHMENFALYEVWALTAQANLDEVVAFTDKISYCLRDDSRSDREDIAPGPRYTSCDQQMQGISTGWVDTYEFDTPGQIVNITDVSDGVYALRSTVDPDDYLQEMNNTNNGASVYFELDGTQLRMLDRAEALRQLQLSND